MSKQRKLDDAETLRRRAEALLEVPSPVRSAPESEAGSQRLIHELQVHQVELELQNVELRQARDEIERALMRYTELYDLAPVAYLSLDRDLLIREINLAAADLLRSPRSRLVGMSFLQFVAATDRPRLTEFASTTLVNSGRATCQLSLTAGDGPAAQRQVRIDALATESGELLRAAVLDVTEQARMQQTVWRQANYDALTQLPNRSLFFDRLRHELEMTQRAGQMLALLFIDLDEFKEVNDTYGHDAGDQVLAEAARRMSHCVRATDTLARRGGDEFYLALSPIIDTDRVGEVARDIVEALASPFTIGDATINVSASIGVTVYPGDADDTGGLLRNADQAMYQAKAAGRNRFCYFTHTLQVAAQGRLDLLRDLRVALTGGQFEVYFQPIVELATGEIVKAEALLRWHHPQRGLVGAAEFIAATDDAGLSGPLGDWVFAEAMHWAGRWRNEAERAIQVCVNVSPAQFARSGSAARWARMLDDLALDGSCIAIDVNEDLLQDGSRVVASELRRMRELGITVAIDGFGGGRSALSSLTRFAIDVVKLSRRLVGSLPADPRAVAMVEAIITLAHKLGIRVVGEGIESTAQRDMLRAAGCQFGQGFLFAPALTPEGFWARGVQLPR